MTLSNAYCPKCDEMEPQDWDYELDGLWTCSCKPKLKMSLDEAMKIVEEKLNKGDK